MSLRFGKHRAGRLEQLEDACDAGDVSWLHPHDKSARQVPLRRAFVYTSMFHVEHRPSSPGRDCRLPPLPELGSFSSSLWWVLRDQDRRHANKRKSSEDSRFETVRIRRGLTRGCYALCWSHCTWTVDRTGNPAARCDKEPDGSTNLVAGWIAPAAEQCARRRPINRLDSCLAVENRDRHTRSSKSLNTRKRQTAHNNNDDVPFAFTPATHNSPGSPSATPHPIT